MENQSCTGCSRPDFPWSGRGTNIRKRTKVRGEHQASYILGLTWYIWAGGRPFPLHTVFPSGAMYPYSIR